MLTSSTVPEHCKLCPCSSLSFTTGDGLLVGRLSRSVDACLLLVLVRTNPNDLLLCPRDLQLLCSCVALELLPNPESSDEWTRVEDATGGVLRLERHLPSRKVEDATGGVLKLERHLPSFDVDEVTSGVLKLERHLPSMKVEFATGGVPRLERRLRCLDEEETNGGVSGLERHLSSMKVEVATGGVLQSRNVEDASGEEILKLLTAVM